MPRRLNQDGGIWRLTWTQLPDGRYRAWVETVPSVAVEAATWNEAAEALLLLVDEQLQAGEWTADWFPPAPLAQDRGVYVSEEFVELGPDTGFDIASDPDALFEGGVCHHCGTARGPRNDEHLEVWIDTVSPIMFPGFGTIPPSLLVARADCVEALGEFLAGAESRPVNRLGQGRIALVEIIAPPGPRQVGVRGAQLDGWRCPDCNGTCFSMHGERSGDYWRPISESDLPLQTPAFWSWDSGPQLCVRRTWWQEARKARALRGIITRPLMLARAGWEDRSPVLRSLEQTWNAYDHMKKKQARRRNDGT